MGSLSRACAGSLRAHAGALGPETNEPHAARAGQIAEQYPWLQQSGVLEVLLPKKQDLSLVKL